MVSGALSSSQSLTVGEGVSASQSTEMAGLTGRVASGAFSQDEALLAAGSFFGAGSLSAGMSSGTEGAVNAAVSVDGKEWLEEGDLRGVSSTGTGMSVQDLRFDRTEDIGSFRMQAASLVRADLGRDEGGTSSAVMYLNNPNAYELLGWMWEEGRQIQMQLKNDAYLQSEGLDVEATRSAIAAAASTWDDAVPQNLFADSDLVTVTEDPGLQANTTD